MRGAGRLWDELHDGSRRRSSRAHPPVPRLASAAPTRARRSASADRDDELRPGARARLRGGGGGARRRRVRGERAEPGAVLAPAAGPAAAARGGAERVHRALARRAHRPPQAPRRRRPSSGAGVGELRRDRGRPHRVPRALRACDCSSRSPSLPGCAAATSSSSATRWPTGTCALVLNRVWGGRPVVYGSWAAHALRAPSSAGVLAALRRDAARHRPGEATSSCSSGGWRSA